MYSIRAATLVLILARSSAILSASTRAITDRSYPTTPSPLTVSGMVATALRRIITRTPSTTTPTAMTMRMMPTKFTT
ncbi:MAG: hypothetical protein DRJ50_08615 [Actinobacteria bacterium]|nr:MAG: hypothetical protein DRJ50_08615 [Actinomycetota bacterium]